MHTDIATDTDMTHTASCIPYDGDGDSYLCVSLPECVVCVFVLCYSLDSCSPY